MILRPALLNNKWPRVSLGEAVEFLDHMRKPITASERKPGPYPYYGANGQQDSVAAYIFDEPLILLAEDGGHFDDPVRGVAYGVSGKCWVNNHAHVLRPKSDFDFGYLRWHLAHYDLSEFVNGTTRAKLTKSSAQKIPLIKPPLAEQRRIADTLDKADAVRRKRKQMIALTEKLPGSALLETFGAPGTNPKGWPMMRVGDVAEVAGGLQVTSARARNPISLPYLRVANVYRDRLDLGEVKQIRVTASERERALLRAGDVLVVEGHGNAEELGRSAVWNAELSECTHQNHLIRVRCDARFVRPTFMSAFLNSSAGRVQMLKLGKTTSGLNTISTNNVRSVNILVPPLALQDRFDHFVEGARNLSARMQNHRHDDDLFGSLLSRAFSRQPRGSDQC